MGDPISSQLWANNLLFDPFPFISLPPQLPELLRLKFRLSEVGLEAAAEDAEMEGGKLPD